MKTLRKILNLLTPKEKRQAFFLFCFIALMAFVEILGVASILPFMSVLANPQSVQDNEMLRWGYEYFQYDSINSYMFSLGLLVLAVLVFSNILKAVTRWMTLFFSQMCGYSISQRLFSHYLNQPYKFFAQRNSSELSKNILAEIEILVQDAFMPIMNLTAHILVVIAILILLLIVNPLLAVMAGIILGGAYFAIYLIFHRKFHYYGQERQSAQAERYKVVNEAFQGIKNVKLTAHEPTYRHYFKKSSHRFASSLAKAGCIGEIPRYGVELIGFGGLLLIILYLLMSGQQLQEVLPILALYAFAGYRLMPSLQMIYISLTKMRFGGPILDTIEKEITQARDHVGEERAYKESIQALPFNKDICLSGVSFRYDNAKEPILKNIDLVIPANTTMGIIGKTGSGKTTLVDIVIGLLTPESGAIHVDGQEITAKNMQEWQANIAYVSQHIYLCDDTVARNIAFGVADDQIDLDMVKQAAKMACIGDFIEQELADKYQTVIGENGVRLSGGQRQRIGLARALYLNRPILVLDEATSALDIETESDVMKAIDGLAGQKTIIIIAHRLATVEKSDQLIKLEKGHIV